MRRNILILVALALAATAVPVSAELYRWVDENGTVHYGDRIPPKYAKIERERLDDTGAVRETLSREMTPEEKAASEAAERQLKLEKERKVEQDRYDRFLLATYEEPEDLIAAGDDRLETMDGQILATEKSVADSERILADLQKRASAQEQAGRPVPPKLQKQIAQWDATLLKGAKAVQRLKEDRAAAAAQYKSDLDRYLELRGLRLVAPGESEDSAPEQDS